MFFGVDCRFHFKFRLIFAEKMPSSAMKSYMPSYLLATEITERMPTLWRVSSKERQKSVFDLGVLASGGGDNDVLIQSHFCGGYIFRVAQIDNVCAAHTNKAAVIAQ